jgi:hypothetical protein
MPGARCARSRAWCVVNTRVSHHGHTGTPGIPRAMVLTVSFVLSSVTGLVCHRHRRNDFQQLDTSVGVSGPHDFAVRLSTHSSSARQASTASPAPRFVTIAKRPSCGQKTRGNMPVICPTSQAKRSAANWHDGQITRGGAYGNTGVKNQRINPSFSVADGCLL